MVDKSEITQQIYGDLLSRNRRGLIKYNQLLDHNNSDDMIQHAYEEALDLCQYLKKEINTRKTIQKLIQDNPNDTQLGTIIRKTFQ